MKTSSKIQNQKRELLLTPTLIAWACACTSPLAWAQTTDDNVTLSNSASLATVVISATKRPIEVSDAPAAVTVIERREMDARNIARPADALKAVPSLYTGPQADGLVNRASCGSGSVTLRGVPGNRSLVLLDGQSVQGANSGSINWRAINMDELQSIEVVPGAFSSLYGSGAVGGVINMISKKPDKRELIARWKHGFGDAAGNDTSLFFRDRFESGLGVMVSASKIRRTDYQNDAVVLTPVAGAPGTPVTGAVPMLTSSGATAYQAGYKALSPWQQDNASIKLTYELDARSQRYAGYQHTDFKGSSEAPDSWLRNGSGTTVTSGTLGIEGRRVVLRQSDFVNTISAQTTKRQFAGYEGMWGADNRVKFELARIADDARSQAITSGSAIANGSGRLTLTPSEVTDALAQISRPLGEKWFVVAGASISLSQVAQRQWGLSNWRENSSRTALNEGYDGRSTTSSLFGQLEWHPLDPLTVYMGGRWDQWNTSGKYFRSTPLPAIADNYSTRSESAFSPKLSAVYKATDQLTLRASAGTSFQAPNNLDLYARSFHGPTVHMNDPALKPERGVSWEVGAEQQISSNAKAGATYFHSRLTDMIALRPVSATQRQIVNIGEASVRGIELTGKIQLATGVQLATNYSWIDAVTQRNDADPASVGKKLTSVPDQLFYAGLTVERGPWSGAFDMRYTGKVFANSNNSDTTQGVPGAYDAYTSVNTRIGYRFNRLVQLQIGINNLLDRKAYQSILMPGRSLSTELVFTL